MKKHYFNSLTDFYANVQNKVNSPDYDLHQFSGFSDSWKGLESWMQVQNAKFTYPVGIQELNKFKDIEVEKDIKVKFWNQLDGYDIDVDRMYENMDFLLDHRKIKKLPKTIDIYINLSESHKVDYKQMLCKTYAALKIIDRLESLGVRCSVYACASLLPVFKDGSKDGKPATEETYIEICIKRAEDAVNIAAICTAISPWMLRHWILQFIVGNYENIDQGVGFPKPLPTDLKGIIIDKGRCMSRNEANQFIQSVKVA